MDSSAQLIEKNIQAIIDWAMSWNIEDDLMLMVDRLLDD
jgi:hypothetical protein